MFSNRPALAAASQFPVALKFPAPLASVPKRNRPPTNSSPSVPPLPIDAAASTPSPSPPSTCRRRRRRRSQQNNQRRSMELFPDEAHVRLRSRAHGTYLDADEDGVEVSLSPHRASLNQAWAVHRLDRGGTSYVLLRGAAYGRYLAVVREDAPPPPPPGQDNDAYLYCRFVQRDYDAPGQDDVLFEVASAEDGSGDVLMYQCTFGWLQNPDNPSTVMSWVVEAIPTLEDPPELPPVILPETVVVGGPIRGRRVVQQPVFRRRIYYVRADDQGHVNNLDWSMFWFDGRSVFLLRRGLANELGEQNPDSITLCVRAGSQGRWTPLVTDLPACDQTMDIVVLATESAAAEALVYPDVGAL